MLWSFKIKQISLIYLRFFPKQSQAIKMLQESRDWHAVSTFVTWGTCHWLSCWRYVVTLIHMPSHRLHPRATCCSHMAKLKVPLPDGGVGELASFPISSNYYNSCVSRLCDCPPSSTTRLYIHKYAYMYIRVHMIYSLASVSVFSHTCVSVYVHVRSHTHKRTCTCVCMHVYICVSI